MGERVQRPDSNADPARTNENDDKKEGGCSLPLLIFKRPMIVWIETNCRDAWKIWVCRGGWWSS